MGLVFKLVAVLLIAHIARTNSIREAPTVSLTPKDIRGIEKGMVYMLCNTTGIPKPNITLYKNGVKITNSRVHMFKVVNGWFIRIGPLKQRHQGTYRCDAANGVGPVVSDSSAILRVYQVGTTPIGFPRIGRGPRSQFKKSGDKVVFKCAVTGSPTPSVMWLQNKVPLDLSKRRYSVSSNGDLTIVNLEKADKGSYACVAENSKGMVITRDARLFVREVRRPPRFVTRPVDQAVNPDSNVYLNCSATGFPKPAIVWERDGRRISGGADGFLVINRIQRSGNYTCIADSFMGRVKAYAFVKVKLLPFAPTRLTTTGVSADSITVTWQSSGSHVVTSFVVEHKLQSEAQWKSSSVRGTRTLKISNLRPYSKYQIRVFAVNSLGRSSSSPVAEYTTSQSKPSSPPINITAKGVSDTSFRADWLPPLSPNGPIRGYRVYYSLDQKEAFSQWRFMASATNHATVTGLSRQTTYFFKVAAYNMAGKGPPSDVMAVKTHKGVPGQPHGVRLVVRSSTSIQISWRTPRDPGDGIFGYEVYYNKSSPDMDTNVGASNGLSNIIMGLTPYTVYKFGVAAKSDKGIGPMSFAVTARTKEDAPSGSPRNIKGKSRDSTTLEIKWDPPLPIHRNGIITDYTIKYKTKGRGRPKYMTVDGIKTSVVLHNLKKFTKYFVWVSASTKQGEGPMSSKKVFSTAEDVPSGAPTQLKAAVLNSSCIKVSWSPPTTAQQDGNIMGYMVFYSKVDDLGNQLKPPAPVEMKDSESETNLKVYLTKLAPETTYQIEVAGYTIKGDGARSVTKLAKTLPRLPDAPFVFTQKSPGNPSVVILGWRTSASDVLGYKVRYGKALIRLRGRDLSDMNMEEKTLSKTTTKQTFQKLGRGIWYLFNVSLRTKAGWSPETAKWVQIPPGPPTGPPLNVTTKASSSTNIKVTWSPPDEWKRGGGITKYIVMYNPVVNQKNISRKTVHGENRTRVTLKKLMKYTTYEIRVMSVNSQGEGPQSAAVEQRTKEDKPGRPRNLVLKAQSSSVVTLQWQEPRNPNGVIRKYKIIYTDSPTTDEESWKYLNASGLSTSLRKLARDEKYWVRVAAVTSVGIGEYSKVATVRTLKFDLPGLCRDFKLGQLDSDSLVIEWLPPEIDAGIITYKVSYSGYKTYQEGGNKIPLIDTKEISISAVNNKKQSYKIDNLVPHMQYKLRISAINAMGEGPKIKLNCNTKKDKPARLTKPEVIYKEVNDGYIPVLLSKASERNGPVSYYLIVVVPLGKEGTLPKDDPDSYFKRVKRSRRSDKTKPMPYIAAKFMADQFPERFHVGEESSSNQFGYINKRLNKGMYYTIFSRAYVERENKELVYKSSPFTDPVSAASPYTQTQTAAKKGETITLIIIVVVMFIILLAVVALAVICLVRRRRRSKDKKYNEEEKSEPSDPVELRRLNFQTPAMIDHPPIPVGDLAKHISHLKAEKSSKFSHEYESIEPGQTFTTEASTAEVNRPKNRYPNILAYDHSRVRLSNADGYQDSDYINANFCDGYRKEKAYIATQGPLPNTTADFWRMIWEQRTFTIVMLTREEERGRVKCEQYWPNEGTSTYDDIEVSLVDWVELANYTITTLQISMEGESQPREVKHFQFTGWPDHGVPPHPTPFLAFLRRVKFYNPPDAGPIVAHCSAGVGRTAIFIVIDSMLERIKHENTVDIYGHVTVLRTQRNYMVQTLEQYIFIHDALLEAVSAGNTEVHARNLLHHIKKLTELGKGEVTGLEEEFKNLIDPTQARRHKHGAATLAINRPKNRMANILPYESTRVHISPVRGVEGSDYINASFIDGYRQRAAFIATQGPLQDTVDDFWRMLMEQNSNIIVMMTKLHEGEWDKCYKYWPTDRSARHQYYIVDPVSEQEFAQFVMRDFKVKDARNDTVRNIKQFHFTGWPETGVPKTGEGIIDLIGQVQRVYEQQEEDGPVTVHCSDGVGRTGVFCSLFIVLERMRSEGVVDLFQTVKLLRTQRPAMVQSQEQYLFCYKTALEYLGSFDHYAT